MKKLMKKLSCKAPYLILMIVGAFVVALPKDTPVSAADTSKFNPGYIVSDDVFYNSDALGPAQIQQFLSSKVPTCDTNGTQIYSGSTTRATYGTSRGYPPPYTCLKDYVQTTSQKSADAYCSGYSVTTQNAADMIYGVAKSCGVNPQVLIVLLQKEQGLVTDDWPWSVQYRSATGMGCPDTAACDSQYYGFFNQVYHAARQYKLYKANPNSYSYIAGRNNYIQWNPQSSCGGSTVYIQNQATAGLYNYTPYRPNDAALAAGYGSGNSCSSYGNRNFWLYFTDWFGSTVGGECYNGSATSKTSVLFHKYNGSRADLADFVIYGGTGSGCIESHVWNPGFTSWQAHIASIQPGTAYPATRLEFGDFDGNKTDYPILFGQQATSTNKIEAHLFTKDLQNYLVHVATNQPVLVTPDQEIITGDLDGNGKDEPIIVAYQNTGSGMVELHGWGIGMQSWSYHVATNRASIDPAYNQVRVADLNGDGRREIILVSMANTGSGMVEFHVWNPGAQAWASHVSSNQATINPADSEIEFADINGNGKDQAVLVGLRNTGSGMIEFHVWNPGFTSWQSHAASNQPSPSQ